MNWLGRATVQGGFEAILAGHRQAQANLPKRKTCSLALKENGTTEGELQKVEADIEGYYWLESTALTMLHWPCRMAHVSPQNACLGAEGDILMAPKKLLLLQEAAPASGV